MGQVVNAVPAFLLTFLLASEMFVTLGAKNYNICTIIDEDCDGDTEECSRSIPCIHGECSSRGSCSCHACWHGENCNQYIDDHPPRFLVKSKYVRISALEKGDLFDADAFDEDTTWTCAYDYSNCACALMSYSIISGNEERVFTIHERTGTISVTPGSILTPGEEYHLTIKVSNNPSSENVTYDYQMFDHLTVTISVTDDNDPYADRYVDTTDNVIDEEFSDQAYTSNRKKRSTGTEPVNTVFTLTQQTEVTDKVDAGNQVKYQFEILLPQINDMDFSVEIFTIDPETKTTSLNLCSMKIADAGAKVSSSKGNIKDIDPEIIKTNDLNSRALFDFGKVSSTEDQKSNDSGKIVITFVVVLMKNEAFKQDEAYHVVAGAKYNTDEFVWVGQAELIANLPADFETKIYPSDYKLYGKNIVEESVHEEEAAIFTIDAFLVDPSPKNVTIDVFSPIDDMVDYYSVGNLRLLLAGDFYPCMPENLLSYPHVFYDSESEKSKYMGSLSLGPILNCDPKRTEDDIYVEHNTLRFEVATYVMKGAFTLDSKQLYMAVGMLIGESVMWTAIANLTVLESQDQADGDPPKIKAISPANDAKFPEEGIALVQFQITYKENQFYKTKLEISVSSEDTMSICKATLVYRGFNIPFVPKFEHEFTPGPEPNTSKSVVIDLGRIQTTAQLEGNETANSMIIEVAVRSVKAVTDGTVTLKVSSEEAVSVKLSTKEPTAPADVYIEMANVLASSVLFVNGETSIDVNVELPVEGRFDPFDVEVMGTFGNNTVAAKICRVEVTYTGRLLPCVNKTSISEGAFYDKTMDSRDILDRGIMGFGSVCTATSFAGIEGIPERSMRINFVAEIPQQEGLEDVKTYWLNAGIKLGEDKVVAGSMQFDVKAEDDQTIEDCCGPILTMTQQNDTAFGQDSAFYLLFRIKLPSRSRAKYVLTVKSASDTASICRVAFLHVGHNMPCIDTKTFPGKTDPYSTTWLNYVPFSDPEKGNEQAILDFGSLANTGKQPMVINEKNDYNTLYIGVPFRIISSASDDRSIEYTWTVNGKGDPVTTAVKFGSDLTVDGDITATIDTLDGNKNIYDKVSKIIYVDLKIPPGYKKALKIHFEDKDKQDKFTFCSGSVTHIGLNLPCINSSVIEPAPNSTDPLSKCNSTLTMDIGMICHSATFFDPKENELRVEVAINAIEKLDGDITILAKVDPAPPDDLEITLSPTDDKYTPLSKLRNDSAWFPPPEKLKINVSKKEWIPITIKVPLNTTVPITVTAVGEAKDERAVITVYDIRLGQTGVNLRCMRNATFITKTLDKSEINRYSQTNKLEADLNYVTNLGFTYRRNDYRESDDNLTVEVQVRMTDHTVIENDESYSVAFSVKSDDVEINLIQNITAVRDGTEEDIIELEVTVDNSIQFNKGDTIPVRVIMRLANESRLEPGDVLLRFLLPPFIVYKEHTSNITGLIKSAVSYVQFEFKDFLYDDVYELNLTLDVDPSNVRPAGSPPSTFMMITRAVCKVAQHPNFNYPTDFHFCSESTVTSMKIGGSVCDSFIGKKSGTLQDCQMSASSAMNNDSHPSVAEVGQDKCWSPAYRTDLNDHYYQIDFGAVADLRMLQIESCSDTKEAIQKYQLLSSTNGKIWKSVKDSIDANYDSNLHTYECDEKGRFFRIKVLAPLSPAKPIGARFEFKGCLTSPPAAPEAICKANPPTLITSEASVYRHFTGGKDNSVYMCDYNHCPNKPNKLNCFCSVNGGKSWKSLPAYVAYILGYNSKSSAVIVTDKKGKSKMKTSNCVKWEVAKGDDLNGIDNSIPVPAYPADELKDLKSGEWTADYDGLKIGGALKLSWKKACR